jgi:arsenite-transporting ATPase
MSALELGARRIVFVAGKGGVGKTTTAAAVALRSAESGLRTLLVSTDPAHSLGDLFDLSIGDREVALAPGLTGLEIEPETAVHGYLDAVKQRMRDFVAPHLYGEIDRQLELARLSPGAIEAALMDRMTDLMELAGARFDRIVFDTAPTGHTLRLVALPEIMSTWTEGLLRGRDRSESVGQSLKELRGDRTAQELTWLEQVEEKPGDDRNQRIREVLTKRTHKFRHARAVLLDPAACAFLLVLVPEKLPVLETEKAEAELRRHGVPIAALVVNRVLPSAPLGGFLEQRRAQEGAYLERIDDRFAALPRIRVPLLPADVQGLAGLREIARHLFD